MSKIIPFSQLADADLIVEAVYEGGTAGNAGDDPLGKLVPVGNQGGFRYAGWPKNDNVRMAVLYTSGAHRDWPDTLDRETGLFTYFGDNREPGKELHNTSRGGNAILRTCFDRLHGSPPEREKIPPFLVFDKASQAGGRDVRFLGLAVPGAVDVQPTDDLVAIWRTSNGERFQNYRATFTILDVATVSRAWLHELAAGRTLGESCPGPYRDWVTKGKYTPLESPRNIGFRTKDQQMPESAKDLALVTAIYDYFEDPYAFEACAIELWSMQAKESVTYIGTRRSADGGRDAYGHYYVGPADDRVKLAWSLEAKRHKPGGGGAGVKDTSRLISRLRHREFGVFVTTSHVGQQAYEEIRGDEQPIIIICARDIAEVLKRHGHSTPAAVKSWLKAAFPQDQT